MAKINQNGNSLSYFTYLGGDSVDTGYAIAIDQLGAVYVTGETYSDNFLVVDAIDDSFGNYMDAFVAKLDSQGAIEFSTYLGGEDIVFDNEGSTGIAIDENGVYVVGWTQSTTFPSTDGTQLSGDEDAFVAKLSSDGSELIYATYFGGGNDEFGTGIEVDENGVAYIVGWTESNNLNATPGAIDADYNGDGDTFVAALHPDNENVLYVTYLGGSGYDWGSNIAIDSSRDVAYIIGSTDSTDFPFTDDVLDDVLSGIDDVFISKLFIPPPLPEESIINVSPAKLDVGPNTDPGESENRGDCDISACAEGLTHSDGDPINTRTGGFDLSVVDISMPQIDAPFVFQRYYSSAALDLYTGGMGTGWTHNHDTRLIFEGDTGGVEGEVRFKAHSGNQYTFIINGDSFDPGPGVLATLEAVGDDYHVTTSSGAVYVFNSVHVLTSWTSAEGRTWTYTYDTPNNPTRLLSVTDSTGRSLSLGYTGDLLTSVTGPEGISVQYVYTGNGTIGYDLASVTDILGNTWTYDYDDHYLTDVLNPDETLIAHTVYDGNGRAVSQYDAYGWDPVTDTAVGNPVIEFDYSNYPEVTITDALGNETLAIYDEVRGILDHVQEPTDPETNPAGRTYDANFRPETITNENDYTTGLEWSEDGINLTSVTDASGNAVDFEYDTNNNLILVTNVDGTLTHFVYNMPYLWDFETDQYDTNDPNPDYTSNWDEDLLVKQIADYGGDEALTTTYVYTYNDAVAPDNLLEQVNGTDSVTCYTYNSLGQTTEVINGVFGEADPCGHTDALSTGYTYDNLGRTLTVTGTDGRTTKYIYHDADNEPDVVIRNWDLSESGSGWNQTTVYRRDAAGRITDIIENAQAGDIDGQQDNPDIDWGTGDIDGDGNADVLQFEIDPDQPDVNQMHHTDYDRAGRALCTITNYWPGQNAYHLDLYNFWTVYVYDAAGQLTDTIQNAKPGNIGGGGQNHFQVDLNQNGTIETSTEQFEVYDGQPDHNLVSHTDYDAAGRTVRTINNYWPGQNAYHDNLYNFWTVYVYDAAGQLTDTIQNAKPGNLGDQEEIHFEVDIDQSGSIETNEEFDVHDSQPDYNRVSHTDYDPTGRTYRTISNYWPGMEEYYQGLYNFWTVYEYDSLGRRISTISNAKPGDLDGGGITSVLDIDFDNDETVDFQFEIDPDQPEFNQITRTVYDDLGRVVRSVANAWPGQGDYHQPQGSNNWYNFPTVTMYDEATGRQTVLISNYYHDGQGLLITPEYNAITRTYYDDLGRVEYVVHNSDSIVVDDTVPTWSSQDATHNLVTRYYYDAEGRQIAVVRNYYDLNNNGILEEDEDDFEISNYLSVGLNRVTRTYYDDAGRVEYVVNYFVGDIINDSVPVNGSNSTSQDFVTRYYYNAEGRQIAVVNNYYNPDGGDLTATEITDNLAAGLNQVTRTYYNAAGRVSATVNNFVPDQDHPLESGNTPPGFSTSHTDRNLVTTYSYDVQGHQYETTIDRGNAGSRTSHTNYDALGRVTEQIANYGNANLNPANVSISYAYDLLGRQTLVTDPLGYVRQTVYDALGRTSQTIVDPSIDDPGDPEYPYDGLDLTTTTTYDLAGRVTSTSNLEGEEVDYVYDNLGRTTATIVDMGVGQNDLGETTTYDLRGRVETVTDAEGIITYYEYDNLGRLVIVMENYDDSGGAPACNQNAGEAISENVCTEYSYDVAGNLTQVTLGNGSTTGYDYDALGRLTQETIDPDQGGVGITTTYTYDAAGNQKTVTQAAATTTYTYDGLGRVEGIDYPGSTPDVSFTYDSFGNRASMTDGSGIWVYIYDDLDRLLSVVDSDNNVVTYTYDANGNRTTLELVGSPIELDYAYDAAGRLESVSDPFAGVGEAVEYTYDDASRVETVTYATSPDEVIASYSYDPAGRLQEILNGISADPDSLSSFTYTLNDIGSRSDAAEMLAMPGGMAENSSGGYAALPADPSEDGAVRARPAADLIGGDDDPTPPPDEDEEDDDSEDESESTEEASPEADETEEADPTATPTPTPKPEEDEAEETDTPTPDPEETEEPATATPTPTPEDELTEEPTEEATATPTPTATASPTPTDTPTPTESPTPSPSPTDTPTPEATEEMVDALVVTSAKDSGDADLSDGQCDDGDGNCTLRAALEEANARSGPDTITFDLPEDELTISLESALPAITGAVTLDGASQPDYKNQPVVTLDGANAEFGANGFVIRGGDSEISGLIIVNFEAAGILIESANNTITSCQIDGNQVGVLLRGSDSTGNTLTGNQIDSNAETGIMLYNAPDNTIGGQQGHARNQIEGSPVGVYLYGADACDNLIAGNTFGADREGSARAAVVVNGAGDNIISGNQIVGSDIGVYLYGGGATGNRVQGNDINGADNIDLDRLTVGVYLYGATNNAVGGERSGEENQIAGGVYGILVRGSERRDNDLEHNTFDRPDREGERGRGADDIVVLEEAQPEPAVEEPAPVDTSGGERRPRTMAASLLNETFTVDSTGDAPDNDPGDGDCDTGSGVCTLRAAIQEANATAGLDTIAFDISGSGPHTIQPGSDLPTITDLVSIVGPVDTYGNPTVELDGENVDTGLYITGGGSTVSGLSIYGCGTAGIGLASDGNTVKGSYIGLESDGETAQGNGWVGIYIDGGEDNIIGGTGEDDGNVISGNSDGIAIFGGADDNVIQGNIIGLDAAGATALGNSSNGIIVENSSGTQIGGSETGAGNIIAGNGNGIEISNNASDNTIWGNLIGTDAEGNLWNGILINGAGGTSVVDNTITGNGNGIRLINEGATGSLIQGNTIGLGANGNLWEGIYIENAPANIIGGDGEGEGNVISANGGSGIVIEGGDAASNVVQGNIIGLDAAGSTAHGNSWAGININNAPNTTIGGDGENEGNVISANEVGVAIFYSGATGSLVQNNIIGLSGDESQVFGNLWEGVYLNGASGSTVGGNHITGSDIGILVNGDENATGNALRGNAISGNDYLGIDLGDNGVTANDTGDADSGPNGYQNFPVLTSAAGNSTSTTVEGTLNSTANTQFTIDFYASAAADPSGYGEGALHLGSTTVTTDGSGNAAILATGLLSTGGYVWFSATATSPTGNTSEFSLSIQGTYDPGEPPVDGSYDWHYEYDGLNRLTYACDDWDSVGATCDGNEWDYTYDGAGNLLTMSRWDADTQTVETVAYIYNGANQLACVDGNADEDCEDQEDIVYSYDAYGNLVDDGVSSYTYDAANRLTEYSDGLTTTEYTSYDGDGNRISQTVVENGITTTTEYVLDIGTPLTMVLAETTTIDDGVNPPEVQPTIYYLHGLDLVAQSDGTNTEYFTYDALGSVRQVIDDASEPVLTQTFDPYGSPYAHTGAVDTSWGFAGEQTDDSGLIYLRARYYNPQQGRFLNIDPSRQEMNPYRYSNSNPVMFVDPSGLITEEEAKLPPPDGADVIYQVLSNTYNVHVMRDWGYPSPLSGFQSEPFIACHEVYGTWYEGEWEYQELLTLLEAVNTMSQIMTYNRFLSTMGSTTVVRVGPTIIDNPFTGKHIATPFRSNAWIPGMVILTDHAFEPRGTFDKEWAEYMIVHEFGHRWDWNTLGGLSRGLSEVAVEDPWYAYLDNPLEDWADSYARFVIGSNAWLKQVSGNTLRRTEWDWPRLFYVVEKIQDGDPSRFLDEGTNHTR